MKIEVNIPDGKSGDWSIDTVTIDEAEAAIFNLKHVALTPDREIRAGTYKRLICGDITIMSNTPAEINDHMKFIDIAKEKGGDILINGLGLAMCVTEILKSDKITSITIIEKSKDVIKLVKPYIKDARVSIINQDAFLYMPDTLYTAVWHDIWADISDLNIDEMNLLHEKYELFTGWQDSWCREGCEWVAIMRKIVGASD